MTSEFKHTPPVTGPIDDPVRLIMINDEWAAHVAGLFGIAANELYWASDIERARDDAVVVQEQIAKGDAKLFATMSARLHRSTNQSIPDATETAVIFTDVLWDIGGLEPDEGLDSLNLPEAGLWLFGAGLLWAFHATGWRRFTLILPGGIEPLRVQKDAPGVNAYMSGSTVWKLEGPSVLQVSVEQNSGGNLNIKPSLEHSIDMWAHRLGPL